MLPTLAEPVSYNAEKITNLLYLLHRLIDTWRRVGENNSWKIVVIKNEEELLRPWQPVIVQCYNEKLVCLNDA